MFNKYKVIKDMTFQGKQYQEQEKFFEKLWEEMQNSFTEENHTTSAIFILERLLTVLPLHHINKDDLINIIDKAYSKLK